MKRYIFLFIALLSVLQNFTACKTSSSDDDDSIPPAKVTEVNASSEQGKIIITWKDPEDKDFYGVKIYDGVETSRTLSLKDGVLVLKGIEKYEVTNLENGKEYSFRLSAVDKSLNESETVSTEIVPFKELLKEHEVENIKTEYVDKIIDRITNKYICPSCNKEHDSAEKAAECCGIPVEYVTSVPAGTYTVKYLLQDVENEKDYVVADVETEKVIEGEKTTVQSFEKTYIGFTAEKMTHNQTEVYVYFNRNQITYTFNTGTEGKFSQDKTVIEVSGSYGKKVVLPENPTSENNDFRKWRTQDGKDVPFTFGEENHSFAAVWLSIPDGYVLMKKGLYNSVPVNEFFISKTEVTEALWESVSGGSGSNKPKANITWNEAAQWCNALSSKEGLTPVYSLQRINERDYYVMDTTANGYRLLTELEWEYAARGGNQNSAEWNYTYSGSNNIDEVCWYTKNSGTSKDSGQDTHEVGTKTPNSVGLYDMSGNVWEWVYTMPGYFIGRGGGYDDSADWTTVTTRAAVQPDYCQPFVGFRIGRNVE